MWLWKKGPLKSPENLFFHWKHQKTGESHQSPNGYLLQNLSIIVNKSTISYLGQEGSDLKANSSWSLPFQQTFIQRSPSGFSLLKHRKTDSLIKESIKSPTSLKKQENCFPRCFSTLGQRPLENFGHNLANSKGGQRQKGNRHRNHMTPYPLCGGRHHSSRPKGCSPPNQSVTQLISPKHRTSGQNQKRHSHSERKSRSPDFRFSCIWCVSKHRQLHSKTISTGLTSHCHLNQMTIGCSRPRSPPRKFQNSICAIISPHERPSQQTQSSKKLTSPGKRKAGMCTSRTSHVLHISTGMNNHTCSQEQLPFEASVSHQMIHSQSIMTQSQSHHHIALLTTSTISNDSFHVILNHSLGPPHQAGHSTNPNQQSSGERTAFPKPLSTGDLKDSRSDQGSRVNQCRHRSRSFHPVCLPNVQSKLSTFSQSTTQLAKANPICIRSGSPQGGNLNGVSASLTPPTKQQSSKLNGVTYTVHQHSFLRRFGPAQSTKPKTNQLITPDSNKFPTNKQSYLIITGDLKQHRSCKLTQKAKKAWLVRIILHVAQAVNMDTQANSADSEHHRSTQRVNPLHPLNVQGMGLKPWTQRNSHSRLQTHHFILNLRTLNSPSSQS